jgi:hypothetical protein
LGDLGPPGSCRRNRLRLAGGGRECLEPSKGKRWGGEALEEQWYVLVECRDEK